ncbi:MAG: hypothetical protein KF770_24590 [Anaerolineae bacterium]|nr:hypothetical protein [Anaerolineae bacterium]
MEKNINNIILKVLLVCSIIAGILGVSSSYITAQEDDTSRVFHLANEAGVEELRQVADQIFYEQVSPEFTQLLYDALNDQQRGTISQRIAELAGVPASFLEREKDNKDSWPSPLSPAYNIQMPHGAQANPNVSISSRWTDDLCDSDPTDNDWVFFANTPQTVIPSAMRWYATSSLVTFTFNQVYGGMLSTYGFHLYQINICLGTAGVIAAGGAANVQNHLKVRYR